MRVNCQNGTGSKAKGMVEANYVSVSFLVFSLSLKHFDFEKTESVAKFKKSDSWSTTTTIYKKEGMF